ncbi:MAG: hypothetical protein JXX29_03090 [Deltaproteobacteria bacterium]|nr:hypothetical protein [Deltaproteobacteria bacterium]MBN2670627.1 hypothetical protein [Deltaproteobacteria bacterium]
MIYHRFTPSSIHALIIALTVFSVTSLATAYYIDTGLSDPCHEKMTAQALLQFIDNYPDVAADIPLPETHLWEMYADAIFENFDFQVENLSQKYFVASLLIGTRWPDEHGRSVTSLTSLYDTHGDPKDQHEHFLRRLDHDYEAGNVAAVGYAKSFIADRVNKTFALFDAPSSEQIIPITEYVEYYGQITLHLWGPAYYMGTAIHTLQDSFSHTVRTDDLSGIVHVMNFLDAVTNDYSPERDGLAHSYGMDECSEKNRPIYLSAQAATEEFLEVFTTRDPQIFIEIDSDWLSYHEGCTIQNHFCNSKWYGHVTSDPTGPIVGCAFSPTPTPAPAHRQSGTPPSGILWRLFFE